MNNKYSDTQVQMLRSSGLSDEEIKSGKLSIFEHIENPADKCDVISILRLLDIIPVMEQEMLDLLISKLTAKGVFRQNLKARLNKISSLLDAINKDVYRTCDKTGTGTQESQEKWYLNMYDFSSKFTNALVNYIHNIELFSNVSNAFDNHIRHDEIINKATLLSKLKPGDIFIFLDSETFCEYTFKEMKWIEEKNEYQIYFCKVANPLFPQETEIPIYDTRLWRPVVVTNLLSEESIEQLRNESQLKSQRNESKN